MKNVLNKIVKFLGFIGLEILFLLLSYFISFLFTSMLVCMVLFGVSIVLKIIPSVFTDGFWWKYLICCIPLAVIIYAQITAEASRPYIKHKKK